MVSGTRLRAKPPLVPLTRGEFFSRVGLLREIDPLIDDAYRFTAERDAAQDDKGHGRDEAWHVSFHGSSFPGDDPLACGRRNLYRMMGLPRGVIPRRGQGFMDAGKDYEMQVTRRLHAAGYLVSTPPWERQTGFEDPDHWLTTSVDSIVLPLRSRLPRVAEYKLVYAKNFAAMRLRFLLPLDHAKYARQTKCQIGMANEAGNFVVKRCHNTGRIAIGSEVIEWPFKIDRFKEPICPQHRTTRCLQEVELLPVRHGWLHYANRDDPDDTREFYFEHDPEFMEAGRRQLAVWREHFMSGELPQTHFDDKKFSHPFGWTWTRSKKMPNSPCQWCDFGVICRDDHRQAVKSGAKTMLGDSAGIDLAMADNQDYDYETVRAAVLARWPTTQPQKEAA